MKYRSDPEGSIGIVLAAYNGANFLTEQLESISQQDYQKWDLFVRDDGSHDDSQAIVETLSKKDRRVHVLTDAKGNLGVKGNFASLMQSDDLATCGYIAFSDQDDVWLDNKLSIQLDAMRKMERLYPGEPMLVYSDLEVVDASLHTIGASFMHYQGIRHECSNPLHVLLTQNFVIGCTVMINRALLDIALPMPEHVGMHDWWLALCATTFGRIAYLDQPLVKYRQHDANEVGAKHIASYLNPFRVNWWKLWLKGRAHVALSMAQARALADRVKAYEPENRNLKLIEAYAALPALPCWRRIGQINGHHIHCQSRLRHYLMISRLLTLPRQTDGSQNYQKL